MPPIARTHIVRETSLSLSSATIPRAHLNNPLDPRPQTKTPEGSSPNRNPVLPSRLVYHDITANVRRLTRNVQTQEQLDALNVQLQDIAEGGAEGQVGKVKDAMMVDDPPMAFRRGRPRTARITGPTERVQKGGGRKAKGTKRQQEDIQQQVSRSRSNSESSGRSDIDNEEPAGRKRRKVMCSRCKAFGHNITKCPEMQGVDMSEGLRRRTRRSKK